VQCIKDGRQVLAGLDKRFREERFLMALVRLLPENSRRERPGGESVTSFRDSPHVIDASLS
jgi:hypothetical protein